MSDMLRLLVVTDIHHNPDDKHTKVSSRALELLDEVILESKATTYDYVVDLGDRINDENPERDYVLAQEVSARLIELSGPRAHLTGNHDSRYLSESTWELLLGVPVGSRYVDVRGRRLVFFCPNVNVHADPNGTPLENPRRYALSFASLAWLESALATDLPSIVFSHVPFLLGNLVGNYWFENTPFMAAFDNAAEARTLISNSPAILVVSGHTHWNTWHCVDGVHYLTIASLVDKFITHPDPAGAFARLQIDDKICVEVCGRDRMKLLLDKRTAGRLWL